MGRRTFPKLVMGLGGFTSYLYSVSAALNIRPSADDYTALGIAAKSCNHWLSVTAVSGENSPGFLLMSRAIFCTGAQSSFQNFQIMNIARTFFSVLLIIIILSIFTTKLKFSLLLAPVIYNLVTLTVSSSTLPIRQYLGSFWVMQWVQHSAIFLLTIYLVVRVAVSKSNVSFIKANVTMLALFVCASYSILTFVYIIPLVFYFYLVYLRKYSLKSREMFFGLLWLLIMCVVVTLNIMGSFRGNLANEAQANDPTLKRLLGLIALSIRENFITSASITILAFGIGFLASKYIDQNLSSITKALIYQYVWVTFSLFIAEFFTYFATWHHTPFRFLAVILSFLLGAKIRHKYIFKIHKARYVILSCIMLTLFYQNHSSILQMQKYSYSWDNNFILGNTTDSKTILRLPLGLGDRSEDPSWVNYGRIVFGSSVLKVNFYSPRWLNEKTIQELVGFPENQYDKLLRNIISGLRGSERIITWLV